jgi:hypothetical protein
MVGVLNLVKVAEDVFTRRKTFRETELQKLSTNAKKCFNFGIISKICN